MEIVRGETLMLVQDFFKQVDFYERLFDCKAIDRYKNRYASIKGIGFYNREFDIENDVPLCELDMEKIEAGNSVHICFYTDDLYAIYDHVKTLDVPYLSEILYVNFVSPYYYFKFKDFEGNVIEFGYWGIL